MTDSPPEQPASAPEAGALTPGRKRLSKLLILSIVLTILGLAISAVHFLWPTPLMFTLFMTLGQGAFFLAMALYVVVIVADLRRRGVL